MPDAVAVACSAVLGCVAATADSARRVAEIAKALHCVSTATNGRVIKMKIILDKHFPTSDGLRVLVSEHEDSPGEYIISLERGGVSESVCTVEELLWLGGAIAAAGTRIQMAKAA